MSFRAWYDLCLIEQDRSGLSWEIMSLEKLVKDLMRPLDQYQYLDEQEKVGKALKLMAKVNRDGRPLCLIVVGQDPSEKEMIKGFLTPRELVFGLTTRFLKGAERSGPIFWEGQFEAECLNGMNKRVGEIMAPIRAYVRGTEMLMEAVFLLNKHEVDFLPATSKEEVVGMIHIQDILNHITWLSKEEKDAPEVRAVPSYK